MATFSLTNADMNQISGKISKKPMLISKAELLSIGKDIKLVGFNISSALSVKNRSFSPRLLNWVEPYDVSGIDKSLFYTEVNSGLQVGDRVFIINGNYDSDLLIESDKYKKGRDGYKVLFIDKCKIVLDIDYTGILPWIDESIDDFIKVYYIRTDEEFIHANRQVTSRDGSFDYKFNPYQNNIGFIDQDYTSPSWCVNNEWGRSGGVTGTPGFYIKNGITQSWIDITTDLINTGTYSYISPSYYNNNRIKIMNGDFTYNSKEYKEGFVYKWDSINSEWVVDVEHFQPFITKNNFRRGNFKGNWNSGVFGKQNDQIEWEGIGSTWNSGTLLNTTWKQGTINSKYTLSESYFATFDNNGLPYQKLNASNNSGRGYNFIVNSDIESSTISNGSFINSCIGTQSTSSSSIVEDYILNNSSIYTNNVNKAYFNTCEFYNSFISNSELKNTRSTNTNFSNVKSVNSYFKSSVFNNSNYNCDNIVKILAYDEFNAAEAHSISSTFSVFDDIAQKIYKFYISESDFNRLKTGDKFYIKGLKINDNTKNVINFFDKKFKIGTWTEYVDEYDYSNNTFYKRGIGFSAFLSTPAENSYKFTSVYTSPSEFYTSAYGSTSSNSIYHSIDIWCFRRDKNDEYVFNLDFNTGSTASIDTSIIDPYNYGNIIDVSNAYIVDADFDSGIFENSDWNSGHNINYNNDLNISIPNDIGGIYNLSVDPIGNITSTSSYDSSFKETSELNIGDIVFLDSVDYTEDGINITRIPDAYKVLSGSNGVLQLQEITSTSSQVFGLTSGYFYTDKTQNRYNYLKTLKINKSKIKTGLFRRSYINQSLIQCDDYDALDIDYSNLNKVKNLVITDAIFSNRSNSLSNATYLYSSFIDGSDLWNNGIVQNSIWNGSTFSGGTIKESRWVDGSFTGGYFYSSKSFDSTPTVDYQFYSDNRIKSYYKDGTGSNDRYSWESGNFIDGQFYKSDWENGIFNGGRFWNSKFYEGVINGGILGNSNISITDTKIYNGTINYTTGDNATLTSNDTSYLGLSSSSVIWNNGVFNSGVIGSNISGSNSTVWNGGIFNGGEFTSFAKWKYGTFNGGKFTSGLGWTLSSSTVQTDYTWENGIFNGGEFGNAEGLTNSTWYTGEFNGGTFKGRVWNNGIFLYGDFTGSGATAIGGTACSNASSFVDSYSYSYYGHWRDGIFTDIKDKLIKDQKTSTILVKANSPEKRGEIGKFKNALWETGTFSHPNGEVNNSIWLDGTFEKGKFNVSSFNPYVKRDGSLTASFNFDDSTCFWENGDLTDSEFYISRWKNGNFIMGTAVGMIWENGVTNYMNAYNIFWENGLWRNGNWQGSHFDYNGSLSDYEQQILNRGASWSGTSSVHIWNMFNVIDTSGTKIATLTPSDIEITQSETEPIIIVPPEV